MTVRELKQLLETMCTHEDDLDKEVVVETHNGGVPHRFMADITRGMKGFDWTRPYFILWTRQPVVVYREEKRPLEDVGRERLEQLKDAHKRLGFTFIAKAREPAWIEGFIEGFRRFTLATQNPDVIYPPSKPL